MTEEMMTKRRVRMQTGGHTARATSLPKEGRKPGKGRLRRRNAKQK